LVQKPCKLETKRERGRRIVKWEGKEERGRGRENKQKKKKLNYSFGSYVLLFLPFWFL